MANDERVPADEMVEYVDWLVPTDYDILEFFEEHRIIINAADLSRNIDKDGDYTRKRCQALATAGLLQQVNSSWTVTEYGNRFLDGELSKRELPEAPSEDE